MNFFPSLSDATVLHHDLIRILISFSFWFCLPQIQQYQSYHSVATLFVYLLSILCTWLAQVCFLFLLLLFLCSYVKPYDSAWELSHVRSNITVYSPLQAMRPLLRQARRSLVMCAKAWCVCTPSTPLAARYMLTHLLPTRQKNLVRNG